MGTQEALATQKYIIKCDCHFRASEGTESSTFLVNGFGYGDPDAIRNAYDNCTKNLEGVSISNCRRIEVDSCESSQQSRRKNQKGNQTARDVTMIRESLNDFENQ